MRSPAVVYNAEVLKALLGLAWWTAWTVLATAQQATPPVRVNILNVCAPSEAEQKELAAALARVPLKPAFGADFEVARGRTSLSGRQQWLDAGGPARGAPTVSTWVRIRREFPPEAFFSNAQYSFSADQGSLQETLVLRVRDPKDVMQVSIEDRAAAVVSPAAMLATDTPAERIRLERYGKASVALARCTAAAAASPGEQPAPPPDQSRYEPLFGNASAILTAYRGALGVRRTVPAELARTAEPVGAPAAKKKAVSASPKHE